LLFDPWAVESVRPPEPIPDVWLEFITRLPAPNGWMFRDAGTAYRITFDEGEFLNLAERGGDEFILHRIEPAASTLFYMASHDGTPGAIEGAIDDFFRDADD
jgi:hypothetical protein